MSSYATDGNCHNSESGTFIGECGRPAKWVGVNARGFEACFCEDCKQHGREAQDVLAWEIYHKGREGVMVNG